MNFSKTRVVRRQSQLPADILLSIVDCVCLPLRPNPIALPPTDTITKTLLSLTLTSRAIYPAARRLLYIHCLHIHDETRFCQLLKVISHPDDPSKPNPSIENLLPQITSLYLKPYRFDDSIQEPPIHYEIQQLLSILGPHLRRLLIDIPLRSLYPEEDLFGIRPILRSAFSSLPNLEEFCSVRDELYLETCKRHSEEPPLWSLWPKLKTLALYNQDVSNPQFWHGLRNLENIKTVVLTRADGLREVDIKEEWKKQFDGGVKRLLNIVIVNAEWQNNISMEAYEWKEDDKMKATMFHVPINRKADENIIMQCKAWTKRTMLHGTLEFSVFKAQ